MKSKFLNFNLIYFTFLSLIFCFSTYSQNKSEFDLAVIEIKNKDYQPAKNHLLSHLETNKNDFNALYNIGLIEKELKNNELAIWYFERCLKLNPSFQEAIIQIEICNKALNLNSNYVLPQSIFKSKLFEFSLSFWSTLSLCFSFILSFLVFITFYSKKSRKSYLFLSLLILPLFVFFVLICFQKANYISSFSHVILKDKVENCYVDKTGNALESILINKGQRLELIQKFPDSERIELKLETGKEIFLDSNQVLFF